MKIEKNTAYNIGLAQAGAKVLSGAFGIILGLRCFIWANVQGSPRLRQALSVGSHSRQRYQIKDTIWT
jgi:hypothetical protein